MARRGPEGVMKRRLTTALPDGLRQLERLREG
jgi:hypothetical protein